MNMRSSRLNAGAGSNVKHGYTAKASQKPFPQRSLDLPAPPKAPHTPPLSRKSLSSITFAEV